MSVAPDRPPAPSSGPRPSPAIVLIAASLHAFPPPALPTVLSNPNEPRT